MSNATQLVLVQQYMTLYGMTIYLILGNIGLLCSIAIFTQPTHRRKPSSIYLLSASICALCGLNVSTIPLIYALNHPNPLNSSTLVCQIQFYIRHIFNQMMRSFFVCVCADRYATSSSNIRIRSFSQLKIAYRTIVFVIIFWCLVVIFPTILRTVENNQCQAKTGINDMLHSIYLLIVLGFYPFLSMFSFLLLLKINLKQIRGRIQPMATINSFVKTSHRKRDRDMFRMLTIECCASLITVLPAGLVPIYLSVTHNLVKSYERQLIECFLRYLSNTFLIFSNNSLSFWIYLSTSQSFRFEFKKLLIKSYKSLISIINSRQ